MKSNIHIFFENFLLSFLTFFKVMIKSKFILKYPAPDPLTDNILIIGNGPSLKNSIKKILTWEKLTMDFLAVNYFAQSELFVKIQPIIYVIGAPEFWITNVDDIYKEKRLKLFHTLVDLVKWDFYLYIPYEAKKVKFWQDIIRQNNHIKIVYYNNTPVEGFFFLNKLYYKNNLGLCRPHNVIIPSLFITINLKYKNIYLTGVEHGWLPNIIVNKNNEVLIKQDHFYDTEEANYKPMKKLGKGSRHLFEVLEKFYLTFKGYFEIKKYATIKNIRIYNLTINSYIDAFEKIDIDNVNY